MKFKGEIDWEMIGASVLFALVLTFITLLFVALFSGIVLVILQ